VQKEKERKILAFLDVIEMFLSKVPKQEKNI